MRACGAMYRVEPEPAAPCAAGRRRGEEPPRREREARLLGERVIQCAQRGRMWKAPSLAKTSEETA